MYRIDPDTSCARPTLGTASNHPQTAARTFPTDWRKCRHPTAQFQHDRQIYSPSDSSGTVLGSTAGIGTTVNTPPSTHTSGQFGGAPGLPAGAAGALQCAVGHSPSLPARTAT